MQCTYPPPLTPDQLSAVIDGSAEAPVYDHLAQCEPCKTRFHDAKKAERLLTQKLYRWDCPSPAQLGDYHLGILAGETAVTVTQHLAECARCGAELRTLRVFMATPEGIPSVQTRPQSEARADRPRLDEIVARLLPRTTALAMRGETTREPVVAEAEGVMIILDLQPSDQGRVSILGQIAAEAQDRWTSALVQLRQSGNLQAMATVSDLGTFQCRSILPGATEIRVTPIVGRTIVVPPIDITA